MEKLERAEEVKSNREEQISNFQLDYIKRM